MDIIRNKNKLLIFIEIKIKLNKLDNDSNCKVKNHSEHRIKLVSGEYILRKLEIFKNLDNIISRY